MLRILFFIVFIVAAPIHLVFAKAPVYKKNSHYHHPAHYKGEPATLPSAAIPKAAACPKVPPKEDFPCMTYTFNPGFYLGFSPGITSNYSIKSSAVYKAITGRLFGGYVLMSPSFYLAAEIFAQRDIELQNYTNAVNLNGHAVGLRTSWGGGFSILPGFIVADTLLAYLRLGTITTHFQDVARTKTGGQVGLGLEGTVTDAWDLRAEYIYSFYPSLPIFGNPRSDQFLLSAVYKIDI